MSKGWDIEEKGRGPSPFVVLIAFIEFVEFIEFIGLVVSDNNSPPDQIYPDCCNNNYRLGGELPEGTSSTEILRGQ